MDKQSKNGLICQNPECANQLEGNQRKYCSEYCRSQSRKRVVICASCKKSRKVIIYSVKRIPKLCLGCSVKLDRKKKSLIQQEGRFCKVCKFFLTNNKVFYCSEECRQKAYTVKVRCTLCGKVRTVPKFRYLKGKVSKFCVSCAHKGIIRGEYRKKQLPEVTNG